MLLSLGNGSLFLNDVIDEDCSTKEEREREREEEEKRNISSITTKPTKFITDST